MILCGARVLEAELANDSGKVTRRSLETAWAMNAVDTQALFVPVAPGSTKMPVVVRISVATTAGRLHSGRC